MALSWMISALATLGRCSGILPSQWQRQSGQQARRGLTYMLPTEAALEAGALLTHRFGPFRWQIATTATDANRFALRVARAVTGRPKVLVFNGSYHGTVDETMVTLEAGRTVARRSLTGQAADLTATATCVEFNDLAAVEAALATGEVAAVLTEPVMTNSCMVLPDPGFHAALRALHAKVRRIADHRRDPYDQQRARRLYCRARARAGHLRRRQMRGGGNADRCLGPVRRCGEPSLRL